MGELSGWHNDERGGDWLNVALALMPARFFGVRRLVYPGRRRAAAFPLSPSTDPVSTRATRTCRTEARCVGRRISTVPPPTIRTAQRFSDTRSLISDNARAASHRHCLSALNNRTSLLQYFFMSTPESNVTHIARRLLSAKAEQFTESVIREMTRLAMK